MSQFKVGDRVRATLKYAYREMVGKSGTVVIIEKIYSYDYGWRVDGFESYYSPQDFHWANEEWLELDAPLSPFEASVQAYIRSELRI